VEVDRIPKIVDDLAEKLFYHNYLINRSEAQNLGLKVSKSFGDVEKLMWDLYLTYEMQMGLGKPFDPKDYAQGDPKAENDVPIALVESLGLCSKISKRIQVTQIVGPPQPGLPPGPQFAVQETIIGWTTKETKEE
jgi:hypothetical protein